MREAVELDGWNPRLTYAPAVRVGDLVFVSGMTASTPDGDVACEGDIVGQSRYIYEKIEKILRAAGGDLRSIVDTQEFYIPDPNYKGTANLRREIFGDQLPASTGIPVPSLIRDKALIEIKVVAHIPGPAGTK